MTSALLSSCPAGRFLRCLLLLVFAAGVVLFRASPTQAVGAFISAPNRFDFVHDAARNCLYISSDNSILVYDLSTNSFSALPFYAGGKAGCLDLSPDGNTLAVANREYATDKIWITLINLETGS